MAETGEVAESVAPEETKKTVEGTKKVASPFKRTKSNKFYNLSSLFMNPDLFLLYPASGVAVTLPALIPEDWGKGKDSSSIMLQRCLMPMHIGPCRMSLEKFYYDAEKKDCLLFFYGGCKVIRNLTL